MTAVRRKHTDLIVIHCSATQPEHDIGVAEIDAWHKNRGFAAIGYHWVIRRDGALEPGRPEWAVGAHVHGHNSDSVGVCLVGGVGEAGKPENNFSTSQFERLRGLLADLLARYPGAEVLGHRDLSPDIDGDGVVEPWEWIKACPCFDVRGWLTEQPKGA